MLDLSFLKSYSRNVNVGMSEYISNSHAFVCFFFFYPFFFFHYYIYAFSLQRRLNAMIRNTIEFYKALKGKNHAQHRLHIIILTLARFSMLWINFFLFFFFLIYVYVILLSPHFTVMALFSALYDVTMTSIFQSSTFSIDI